jgi:hypothetical protein
LLDGKLISHCEIAYRNLKNLKSADTMSGSSGFLPVLHHHEMPFGSAMGSAQPKEKQVCQHN